MIGAIAPIMESTMTLPREYVKYLDAFFIGQHELKRALAAAAFIHGNHKREYTPNVLICGPSGSGKTAITQEMARWMDEPYMYVPITTYTQSGYVGDKVESILDELTDEAIELLKRWLKAELVSLKRLCKGDLTKRLAPHISVLIGTFNEAVQEITSIVTNPRFAHLKDLKISNTVALGTYAKRDLEDADWIAIAKKHKVSTDYVVICACISRALTYCRLLRSSLTDIISTMASNGIVLIDEIDKIAQSKSDDDNVGKVGVQRDLLTLLNGNIVTKEYSAKSLAFVDDFIEEVEALTSTVKPNSKGVSKYRKPVKGVIGDIDNDFFGLMHGGSKPKKSGIKMTIDTGKIWFIGAGAFILDDLSGLIDELRGRFSIITRTKALTKEEIKELVEYKTISDINELTEFAGIKISFEEGAVDTFVDAVFELNEHEPLGARRLTGFINQILANEAMNLERGKALVITTKMINQAASDVRNANRYKMKLGFK